MPSSERNLESGDDPSPTSRWATLWPQDAPDQEL